MLITCKEVITRFKTIEVDETELGLDPEYMDYEDLECDAIREQMWKETADDGWDHEYCHESTFSKGEHEPTILLKR